MVDDGSEPAVLLDVDALADPRIRLLRQPQNLGVSAARNRGMNEARGRYIAFLDSDDVFEPDKLQCCDAWLRDAGYPDDVCLGSRIYIRRGGGARAAIPASLIALDESLLHYLFSRGGILSTDTLVVPAGAGRRTGFRTDLARHEDYDFMWRLERAGARFAMLPEALATWFDEDDPGRLTQSTGFKQSAYWIESVADEIDAPEHAAFQVRVLGPMAAKHSVRTALGIYFRHWRDAVNMSWGSRLVCLLKCTTPSGYRALTSAYVILNRTRRPARRGLTGHD